VRGAGDSQPEPGLDLPDGPVPGFTRFNLREQIKDVILDGIISGSRPPGSRLVETQIARELGVSQTSVREALRDLEQIGCVAHEPFRGCSVRAFSAPELLEAFVRAGAGGTAPVLRSREEGQFDQLRGQEPVGVDRREDLPVPIGEHDRRPLGQLGLGP